MSWVICTILLPYDHLHVLSYYRNSHSFCMPTMASNPHSLHNPILKGLNIGWSLYLEISFLRYLHGSLSLPSCLHCTITLVRPFLTTWFPSVASSHPIPYSCFLLYLSCNLPLFNILQKYLFVIVCLPV